jgi:hypothetical protein
MRKFFQRISHWEAWPFGLLYAPLAPVWIWYMIKSRAVWFFTPSNPKITFGGLEGEPKKEMYALLPEHSFPATFNVLPGIEFDFLLSEINSRVMSYPLIVKPEVGWQGMLLRKIDDQEQLQRYHQQMNYEYMVQQMVTYPLEVSVFYIRHPLENKGTVTGFLQKVPLHVTGNGRDTLQDLVMQHPKAAKRQLELEAKHLAHWHSVIAAGEKYALSHAANHNRGAHFYDLKEHIDDKLVNVFDAISLKIDDFFYGRYDIMCRSVEDLKNGAHFSILEYNGCGAEPNHFYDTGYTLTGAYREILLHWKALYEISSHNSRQGIRPWSFLRGARFLYLTRKNTARMRKLDERIP